MIQVSYIDCERFTLPLALNRKLRIFCAVGAFGLKRNF